MVLYREVLSKKFLKCCIECIMYGSCLGRLTTAQYGGRRNPSAYEALHCDGQHMYCLLFVAFKLSDQPLLILVDDI